MPDDPKNKLAGMIAAKQKGVIKSPPKPGVAPSSPAKAPAPPKAMDKLMAAKKGVSVQKGQPAPTRPSSSQKLEAATSGVKRTSGTKPEPGPAKSAGVSSPARASAVPKPPTAKPAKPKMPRRPPGPGVFSKMLLNLKVHIREEIQEIKKELSAQHLFKPIVNSLSSFRKGASYLRERLSEDSASVKEAYREVGEDLTRLKAYDRSDPQGNLTIVEDEQRQARQYGAALAQIGSIRGREVRGVRGKQQTQADSAGEASFSDQDTLQALATPGMSQSVPPPPDYLSEAPSSTAPPDIQSRQIGDALEQMGSIRQREAALREKSQPGKISPDDLQDLRESAPETEAPADRAVTDLAPQASQDLPPDPVPVQERPGRTETQSESQIPPPPEHLSRPEEPIQSEVTDSVPRSEVPSPDPAPSSQKAPTLASRMPKKKVSGQRKVSKTEVQVRTIRSLQVLFGHVSWKMAIVDPASKPSQLYIPRKRFEENFGDTGFRNAMKAASRIAIPFGGEWKEGLFDERAIEEILKFEFPAVKGNDDPDEKQISSKCDKEMQKRIERFVEAPEVQRLVRNAGSKLSSFTPNLEIIARIYLPLKKGNDVDPRARMEIQKDVMFKYQKARYPEKAARRSRNLALRYFFEHLVDYGVEIYKERKAAALEIKTSAEVDMETRFEALRDVACNLAAERAAKAVLSAQVITELREHIRGAISDMELGIEPGTGNRTELASEEEIEEGEKTPGPPQPAADSPASPSSQEAGTSVLI